MNEITQFLPLLAEHGWWVIIAMLAFVIVRGCKVLAFVITKSRFKADFTYPGDTKVS